MTKSLVHPSEEVAEATTDSQQTRYCGIVRPIAEMGTYTAKHWRDVHHVIEEAVESIGFTLRLVSESDAAGVILTEIVSNLYEDEIVIVDVSGRNPNVMFELGMRLAFEKPAVIVTDDETPFSFDISPVKHIRYPRTLRYADMVTFKTDICNCIEATLNAGPEKKNYLQQFGPIKVTELGLQTMDLSALAQEVKELKNIMTNSIMRKKQPNALAAAYMPKFSNSMQTIKIDVPSLLMNDFAESIRSYKGVEAISFLPADHSVQIGVAVDTAAELLEIENNLRIEAQRLSLNSLGAHKG